MKTYYRGIIKNESKEAEVYLPDYVAVVGKFIKYEGDSMWKVVKVYGGAKFSETELDMLSATGYQILPIIEV